MNVKQLKKLIERLPDHMDVVIKQTITEYPISHVQEAKVTDVHYSEDSGPVLAIDKAFCLCDDIDEKQTPCF